MISHPKKAHSIRSMLETESEEQAISKKETLFTKLTK
jgi:hypothetical protein